MPIILEFQRVPIVAQSNMQHVAHRLLIHACLSYEGACSLQRSFLQDLLSPRPEYL